MLKKIKEACSRFDLLRDECHVTVALSGGADSMALLDALVQLKSDLNISKISAVHFNHGIRGEEALRDQMFVVKQCEKLGVELIVGDADVPAFAKEQRISIELAARELRYQFFQTLNTDYIATAHTASDNIETVIFNLTRGTALSGLCGIPPKRDKYIRPLIFCTRDDVEDYCKFNNIQYVTDSTNLCDDYTRNNIRHNVIPVLKSINTSCEDAVARMTTSVREDEDFINSISGEHFNALFSEGRLNVVNFDALHPSIAKRIIAKFCDKMSVEIDNFHINSIFDICRTGGKKSLAGEKSAVVKDGFLTIQSVKQKQKNAEFEVDISEQHNDLFKNYEKVHNLLLKNSLDCDKIIGHLSLRTRKSGDVIRLKNKNCTKTLKKLFCEYKIPLEERENLPVLCDDNGIVWVHKIGVAERSAVDEKSNRIYRIVVKKV